MTVHELIEKLRACNPTALVVVWPDLRESSGYERATDVAELFVRGDDDLEMRHSRDAKPGYVPAVVIG